MRTPPTVPDPSRCWAHKGFAVGVERCELSSGHDGKHGKLRPRTDVDARYAPLPERWDDVWWPRPSDLGYSDTPSR